MIQFFVFKRQKEKKTEAIQNYPNLLKYNKTLDIGHLMTDM